MKKLIITLLLLINGLYLFSQTDCCVGNYINNGQFEVAYPHLGVPLSAIPINSSDSINFAENWSGLWGEEFYYNTADHYDENTAINPSGNMILPTPSDGNYCSLWISNEVNNSSIYFREGMKNLLNSIIPNNSGNYVLTFDMSSILGFGSPEIAIYGIYNPNNLYVNPPTTTHVPTNIDLYGSTETVLLGNISVPNNSSGVKSQMTLDFSSSLSNFPANGITHIMFTRSSSIINASRYVTVDNFCLKKKFELESFQLSCDGIFESMCGPTSPSGNTFTYQWYGPDHDPTSVILLSEEMCFTPTQPGNYTLVVTDDNGCISTHTISVTNQIQQPNLGSDFTFCAEDYTGTIDIVGQGYDSQNYTITWYHNGQEIQVGGETLMTSITGGEVTVVVSLDGCEPVSDSIIITDGPCCPVDLELAINCETGELYVENLPSDISISTIFWNFNNELIPSATDTTLQVTEAGIYSFGIIFTLSNGVECHHFIHLEYLENHCCNGNTPNPIATIFSDIVYNIVDTKYGPMTVPVVDCGLSIDGSLSTCEDSYQITIQPFNPIDWTSAGPVAYNQVFSGQAPSLIEIPPGTLPPSSNGQFYILTFSVGSPMTTTYIGFWYTCNADNVKGITINNLGLTKEVVSLFPNPTENVINLETNFNSGTYQIYDLHGKIISKSILNSTNTLIDISMFNSGVYFLKIESTSGEVHFKKLIKN